MPIPVEFTFTQLNTQVVEFDGLIDNITGTFINNNATLTCKLVDSKGQVDPVFQNIAVNYVATSNGVYRGIVPGTFSAKVGSGYKCVLDGTNGTNVIHIEIPSVVVVRKA